MKKREVVQDNEKARAVNKRELINIFMACGVFEHIAKEIVKNHPQLTQQLLVTEADEYKNVLREVILLFGISDLQSYSGSQHIGEGRCSSDGFEH
jgi:hypothetical protein